MGVSKINKFIVKPLSSKKENLYLLLTFCILIILAAFLLKFRHREEYVQNIGKNEISAFSSLNNIEASIYSDIKNSLLEISLLKDELGDFPDINTLEKEEIPPYFKDQLWEQKGAIDWVSFKHENEIHYLGISHTQGIGSFLVVIDEKNSEKFDIFYTNEKIFKEDILRNFIQYESLFNKIVPYTGEEERKKF